MLISCLHFQYYNQIHLMLPSILFFFVLHWHLCHVILLWNQHFLCFILLLFCYCVYLANNLYLLLQQLSSPPGLITVSSHNIPSDIQSVSISSLTSTDCLRGVGTPEGCFPLCCPVVLFVSPPHLAAGLWAASLRWLIISCLSRDHLPGGPAA